MLSIWNNISGKITFLITAITVICCTSIGILCYMTSEAALLNAYERGLKSLVTARSLILTNYLSAIEKEFDIYSKDAITHKTLVELEKALKYLSADIEKINFYYKNDKLNKSKRIKLSGKGHKTFYSWKHQDIHSHFVKLVTANQLGDVYLVNKSGVVIYSVTKSKDFLLDLSKIEPDQSGLSQVYHKISKSKKEKAFVPFAPYPLDNNIKSSFIALKIYKPSQVSKKSVIKVDKQKEKEVIGYIIFRLTEGTLNKLISEDLDLENDAKIILLNNRNIPITSSNADISSLANSLATMELKVSGKFHIIKGANTNYYTSFSFLDYFDERLTILAFKTEKQVLGAIYTMGKIILGVTLATLVIILIIGRGFARSLAKPLEALVHHVSELSKGNLETFITSQDRQDEIGDLARTLEEFRTTSFYVKQLEESNKKIEKQLNLDPLTSLSNRRVLDQLSEKLGKRNRESDLRYSFAIIDLNGFKPINDTYGHKVGDTVLIKIAERLTNALSPDDILTRLGGDEFGIVVMDLKDREDAENYAKRVLEIFDKPFIIDRQEIPVGASVGIAYSRDVQGSFEDVISAADKTMFSAKHAGNLSYAIYDKLSVLSKPDLNARNEFENALKTGQIVPYYQPKIDLVTEEIIGFEALARWLHPTRGLLTPGSFFQLIEEYKLQGDFNNIMVKQILAQLHNWESSGLYPLPVAINVDENTLATVSGRENMEAMLKEYANITDLLTIEITEDVFVARAAEAIKTSIEKLVDMGISISMDDFGTGYGSFKHLREFPFNELKIDIEFTSGIGKERSSEVIIDGFLSIAEGLKAKVVAEGIETKEQAEYLKARGCDFAQGFLYGRAMDAESVSKFLIGTSQNITSKKSIS